MGLITGDVQIYPEASCLIMTTEILRYVKKINAFCKVLLFLVFKLVIATLIVSVCILFTDRCSIMVPMR